MLPSRPTAKRARTWQNQLEARQQPRRLEPRLINSLAKQSPQVTDRHPHATRNNKKAAAAAQSRRRVQQPPKDSPYRSSEPRESGSIQPTTQSRTASGVEPPLMETDLLKDDSTIINRLVLDDPKDDIEREMARLAEAQPVPIGSDVTPITGLGLVGSEGVDDGGRGSDRSRQDHSKSAQARRETKFGEYILGQTLGEGEFGKVKMGWKKEGGVQVAIKLIRKETLGSNPGRLPKIYREISILRGLQHPNIVRLHEMVETERYIGIILEYASGGELFDYILTHRYLKDHNARKLFAQLISGVGYLHKKGIVHRDLKLENLLLDRNKNIIITDFGFANTFNPTDELGDEIEFNLANRDFVRKMRLEEVGSDGHKRGDLMATSCGSPCYAAPELVVSDTLYTGRKVDVWSCGVILFAMLAGYLPFDDDPANPEGDNINLLYKYIVSTPLTFPEYVTPHARDLLRRILVPDPRKRADLFEVARHSWLSEYGHVVGFITSSTTSTNEIANTTVLSGTSDVRSFLNIGLEPWMVEIDADLFATVPTEPSLARSASVREPTKPHQSASPGGLTAKHGHIDPAEQAANYRSQRDAKRSTVQLEYVAPTSQTPRGEASTTLHPPSGQTGISQARTSRSRVISASQGPVEIAPMQDYQASTVASRAQQRGSQPTQSSMPPPSRPGRDVPRSVSDSTALSSQPAPPPSTRPSTGNTMGGSSRLPSRGNSYATPAAATVAATTAEGRFSQPRGKQYAISAPIQQQDGMGSDPTIGEPNAQRLPSDYEENQKPASQARTHKRSSTVSDITQRIFGRSSSVRSSKNGQEPAQQKPDRRYPPTSMTNSIPNNTGEPRASTESRRTSFGFSRKNSDAAAKRSSKRFSFLPSSFSMKSFSGLPGQEQTQPGQPDPRRGSVQQPPRSRQSAQPSGVAFGRGTSRSPSQSTTNSTTPLYYDANESRRKASPPQQTRMSNAPPPPPTEQPQRSQATYLNYTPQQPSGALVGSRRPYKSQARPQSAHLGNSTSAPLQPQPRQSSLQQPPTQRQSGFSSSEQSKSRPQAQQQQGRNGDRPGVSQKNTNRKFADAYEQDSGRHGGGGGSSGGARKVMDWFRRRGKDRG
ncbi:hypothetical protein LTR04_007323 [Oleoguttula sp. CCFEE 6159]|nr:hypothetical protein LTR04_007323 [Oleoguttula sp. CCFEE 6159]